MTNALDRFEENTPWAMLVASLFTMLTFMAMVGGKLLFVVIFGLFAIIAAFWNTCSKEDNPSDD